ncbi:chaperonin 10-like protein [Ilyonectria robusta]|uniref:chaperonin 10-like protein n=1 Tax=Ilyonectria robusta TaxID=1079257 RepID=UPI001E8E88E7|nr:chaperonin 10-like protein [Ilyonectria robusta]KAH8654377.1 chaperonin 10-like protein [Ilyonectria robusta]
MAFDIPAQQQALVLSKVGEPMTLEVRPVPKAGPGSIVIRVLAASVRANTPHVYRNPESGHPLPLPFVPGFMAIGRIIEVGPDATKLKPGQLVIFNPYIVGRDNSDSLYVSGLMEWFTEGSNILSRGEWRDSTYAEYAKLPLESCHPLDEQRLLGGLKDGGLGYTLEDLTHLFSMLIPFSGLTEIDIKAGDTVIIAPATGRYGSAAVHAALAMGACVIAIGRNATVLSQLNTISPRLKTVQTTQDIGKDTNALRSAAPGGVDAFWDMSPAAAGASTHFRTCLNVLKSGARISLMGSVVSGFSFSYMDILMGGFTIKGSRMCTQEQTMRLLRLVELGVLQLGTKAGMGPVKTFQLVQWEEALNAAAERTEPGEIVITP